MPLLEGFSTAHFILLGTAIVIAMFLFVVLLMFINQRNNIKSQQKLEALEKKQQALVLHASISAVEKQKRELAANLHDDAGPILASVKLFLPPDINMLNPKQQLETIENAKNGINDALFIIRNISHSLMPPTLERFGLESALNDHFAKLDLGGHIKTHCEFTNYTTRLNTERELHTFRVIQEVIKNILTHSKSTFLNIKQSVNNNNVLIKIQHDGDGLTQEVFDNLVKTSKGLGLRNIEGRIKLLQGSITFEHNLKEGMFETFISVPYTSESIIEILQHYGENTKNN
jgi:two-component system, NarL family, sensor kinase